jgi:hypothetical protein
MNDGLHVGGEMLQRYVGVATDDERRCCKDMAAMLAEHNDDAAKVAYLCCKGMLVVLPTVLQIVSVGAAHG